MSARAPGYAELHAHSAFSFLDGANQPEEMVIEAARLGLSAIGITDHNGLYGVVRFSEAARAAEIPALYGAELSLDAPVRPTGMPDPDGTHLLVLARGTEGYRRLSRSIGTAHLASGRKGEAIYRLPELADMAGGNWLVLTGCRKGAVRRALEPEPGRFDPDAARSELDQLVDLFGAENVAVEISDTGAPLDSTRNDALAELAGRARLPLVATGAVHYATPADQQLAHVLAAVRARSSLDELDGYLPASSSHLRSATEMLARHHRHPHAVATAAALAAECAFDLRLVAPNLPPCPVPDGHTEATWLRELTYRGARERYGPPEAEQHEGAYAMIEHELEVIIALDFPGYFLIVHEIVEFCRQAGILCQGRGSAANSAVCFALGITAVDAVRHQLLFERFLTPGRTGPPDIDLDIESGRREEVIQHVYARYGRTHAAQVANVISYRPRSAVRDAARAFGYDTGQQDAWSKSIEQWGSLPSSNSGGEETGAIPDHVIDVAEGMLRLPRHLGIHSGGMVLCDRPVIDVCPVEWATMPGRTVLQWDKDDCADAGLVKFDLLGLGMLTALRLAFTMIADEEGIELGLHSLPQDDSRVYDLLCAADTVGVFQVESRAQMATLPRLKPRSFYDIVVEVALIRPGPIQGDAVHPYINRRNKREKVTYLHPLLKPALEKTLGVPLFQEQLMQIAVDVASFTPDEADQLRRAMSSKRSAERMEALHQRLLDGMAANGVPLGIAEQIFDKLKAFADFGFPESHAYSFAYLVYASAWLKVHHPEAFYAGLLAAQPMGFYSPQSLVADARRRGVQVERASVVASGVQASIERTQAGRDVEGEATSGPRGEATSGSREEASGKAGQHWAEAADGGRPLSLAPRPSLALRLGLAPIRGVGEKTAQRIVAARERAPFADVADLARRVRLSTAQLEALATAGALADLARDRRQGLWLAGALAGESGRAHHGWIQEPLPLTAVGLDVPVLPAMDEVTTAVADVWATGISPSSFPTQFRRDELNERGVLRVSEVPGAGDGRRIQVAGVVTHRQRPGTARGVTFLSLEDETGLLNVICSAGLWQRYRKVALSSAALVVRGVVEHADDVTNLMADRIEVLSLRVPSRSRDFR
ncbi:error-prone DNA polymerase [Ruania halotolerans]|uniref:error-prone DNA polymerase n=1 Tax=Ruania halotolerans TaxID=2897773 RepID=UPI001E401CB4|nr:error-prone DNA polymerase [Ruania halotolerans]UFU04991.1 error-prone DNA polymerase [Ruania halotolerans]